MKLTKIPSVFLALVIQLAPLASRVASVSPALAASPFAIVLKWIAGAIAVSGAMHAVSAASAPVKLLSASVVKGTNGIKMKDYTIQVGENSNSKRAINAWDINGVQIPVSSSVKRASNGFPAGLELILSTATITGTPKESGVKVVRFTTWEHSDRSGKGTFTFDLTFNIVDGVLAPVITGQPLPTSAQVGGSASFTVTATGSNLAYKWYKDDSLIDSATAATLTISPVRLIDDGNYKAVVTSGSLSTTSNPVRLTVTLPTVVVTHPQPKTVHVGEAVALSVAATGEGALKYEWKKGQTVLPSQTSAQLLIPAATADDAGDYSVAVTGNGGVALSNSAKVTVVALPAARASVAGANAVLQFNAIAGRTYAIEESAGLEGVPAWKSVGTVTPNAADASFTSALPLNTTFWRVRVEP